MEEIKPELFTDCWIGEAPCCNRACAYKAQTFPRKQACFHKGRGEVCCGVLFVVSLESGKSFNISLAMHTGGSQLIRPSHVLEKKRRGPWIQSLRPIYGWLVTKVSFRNIPCVPYVLNAVALELVTQLPARTNCNMDKLDYFWGNLQSPGRNGATEQHLKSCYCVRETWGPD